MKHNSTVRFAVLIVICLLGSKLPSSAQNLFNIAIPNYSFEVHGAGYSGSQFADQSPIPYSPYPTGEIYAGWENTAGNYLLLSSSTAGYTGSVQGASFVKEGYPYGSTIESLNPVTTIANNATYTLTFALGVPTGASPGNVTIELLATTQAADPNLYTNGSYPSPGVASPYPIITTVATLGSTFVSSSTLAGQTAGQFVDYTATFNTLHGANSSFVGDSLSIAVNTYGGDYTGIDNARLTELAVVPEPSTWALMLAGVAGLIFVGRRKLKA